ncbi:MAG TPA: hypothetical protein VKX41_09840 [Alloacidobacterium sp.]|jgi:uncharacterized membrane protein YidH (DUF202 family)|nr:hypothetical protein [Alloacidobacterium sp.]
MSQNPEPDPGILEMLSGMNAAADIQVVQRTRRAVMQAAAELREQRRRSRRNVGVILLTIAVLAMVLTPAIWSSLDDVTSGGDFLEAHSMMTVLSLILFLTVLGALLVGLRNQRLISHGRR